MVEQKIDGESAALYLSGRLYDDGVIDPRDTRTVLGLCLSVVGNSALVGTGAADASGYGVFRM
jgi:acyl-CoA carboxylase subunit beta